jgi:4-hydroxy-tetrahydrodipicolinate synthase
MDFKQKREMWPVMLTPFTSEGSVDFDALARLIDFYEENGADGMFAICQSSEVFFLSLSERVKIASFVKNYAHVPVIASGHISYALEDQAEELRQVADTGVDAVILITNRLAEAGDDDTVWQNSLHYLLDRIDANMPLGLYECPTPYKRLMTLEQLQAVAQTGRFYFLKDTCCDIEVIRKRLAVLNGTPLKLYNANTATLLESLRSGAAGYSGIMAGFHPELYTWLLKNYSQQREKADVLQSFLTMFSQIEKQLYPVNAKYHLQQKGIFASLYTRVVNQRGLTPLFMDEVRQMDRAAMWIKESMAE